MGEEDLDRVREQRLAALKKQQKKRQEWMRKGHGEYREVEEKEFFHKQALDAKRKNKLLKVAIGRMATDSVDDKPEPMMLGPN